MKRCLFGTALLVISILVLIPTPADAQRLNPDLQYAPDVIVIKLNNQYGRITPVLRNGIAVTGIDDIDQLNSAYIVTEMKSLFPGAAEKGEMVLAGYYRMVFVADAGLESVLAAYDELPAVEIAEPVPIHRVSYTPNDPYRNQQWALGTIDAYQAWDVTRGDPTVPVAIMDTGVDWNHPDLDGDIWINTADPIGGGDNDSNGFIDDYRGWDFVTGVSGCWPGEDCSTPDNDPMDFAGHGTHCAGISAAETNNGTGVAGLGFNCRIMCLRIGWLSNNGWGYVSMDFAAQAFYYAGGMGAKAANCSWGSSYTSYLANAVSYATSHGVVVVTAAGNDGNSNAPYLGTRSDVIAVAATDQSDHKASWSNYGTWVDVAAPGVNILSTYFNNTYAYLDGTSMAAPHVVGLAGLIYSAAPSLSRAQVVALIVNGAEPISDSYYNQGLLGSGRINAYNSVADLGGPNPPQLASPPYDLIMDNHYPEFSWNSVPDATVYHLQVSTESQFLLPAIDVSNITETSYISSTSLSDGMWYWHVKAGDGSNWSDWSSIWRFGVDTQPPGSPIGFSVDPDGWSNNPDFTLTWTDPADLSGIDLRFYKVDAPPSGDLDYDGTFSRPPVTFAAETSGAHDIYLWCMDGLGHVDYQTNVSTTLFYDNIPPSGCEASSPPTSPSESFVVSWSPGSDDESGLSGLYDVKSREDDGPWTDWLTETSDLAATFTGVMDHTYYFEARTSDLAGNQEQFSGIAETSTHIGSSGAPCGYYIVGDYNGNLAFNVADIIDAFSKLRNGSPDPALDCECPPGSGNIWPVAMDVNNSCSFNVADIIDGFSRLRNGSPELVPCDLCPPLPSPAPLGIGGENATGETERY